MTHQNKIAAVDCSLLLREVSCRVIVGSEETWSLSNVVYPIINVIRPFKRQDHSVVVQRLKQHGPEARRAWRVNDRSLKDLQYLPISAVASAENGRVIQGLVCLACEKRIIKKLLPIRFRHFGINRNGFRAGVARFPAFRKRELNRGDGLQQLVIKRRDQVVA